MLLCKPATVFVLSWSQQQFRLSHFTVLGGPVPVDSPDWGRDLASVFWGVDEPKRDTAAFYRGAQDAVVDAGEQGYSVLSRAGSSQRSRASPRKTAAGCPQRCWGCCAVLGWGTSIGPWHF